LASVRYAVTEWAGRTPLTPEQLEAVRLATYEAAANVVEHAYCDGQVGVLELDAACRLRQRKVTISVHDHGQWRQATVEPRALRGRGLLLIRRLADFARITTGPAGTTVHMAWALDQHPVANVR
jgi:serine/threonine-protein kinase RsbW